MKKKLTILVLSSMFAMHLFCAEALPIEPWKKDAYTELAGLLHKTHSELSKQRGSEKTVLERLRKSWSNILFLHASNKEDFLSDFLETRKTNFKTCKLPANTPLHPFFRCKTEEDLTPQQATLVFVEIMHDLEAIERNPEIPLKSLRDYFTTLYATFDTTRLKSPLCNKKETLEALNSDNRAAFIAIAKSLAGTTRQAYFCAQEPIFLELHKAFFRSRKDLSQEIDNYKQALTDLNLSQEFIKKAINQIGHVKARDYDASKLAELLAHTEFSVPNAPYSIEKFVAETAHSVTETMWSYWNKDWSSWSKETDTVSADDEEIVPWKTDPMF